MFNRISSYRRRSGHAAALMAVLVFAVSCRPAEAPAAGNGRAALTADPASVATQTLAIDTARLMTDLRVLSADSMEGRGAGTAGAERARVFLEARLEEIGVPPLGAEYSSVFDFGDRNGVNLLGRIEGREQPDRIVVLTAHYDHVGIRGGDVHNGADDNASGVATVLAVAEDLLRNPPRTTFVIALLDAEEAGLQGARAFVATPPVPLASVELNVNLDMVARTAGLLWAAGAHHTPALRPALETVAARAPLTLRLGHDRPNALEGDDWTNSSDHGPFHAAGIPFVYFGVEDHNDYHQPSDDAARVVPAEFAAAAATILDAIRTLDAALPLER